MESDIILYNSRAEYRTKANRKIVILRHGQKDNHTLKAGFENFIGTFRAVVSLRGKEKIIIADEKLIQDCLKWWKTRDEQKALSNEKV